MKKLLKNDLTTLILRLTLIYIVLFACRIVFYLTNADTLGAITWGEVPMLLRGSMVFDTVSVLYLYSLFILLSLIPLKIRAFGWYQTMLRWIYLTLGAVYITLNFADAIYFHYAKKRLTGEEFHFADEGNTGSIILKSMGENWYLLLIGLLLFWGMSRVYRLIAYHPTDIRKPIKYYTVNSLILITFGVLALGGIRGGFSRTTRPIALSNAAQYSPDPSKAVMILSNPFCILRTISMQKLVYTKYFDDVELETIYTPRHYPSDSTDMRHLNVVIFILESFSAEHSAFLNPDLYPDGGGFTPFLDSLMRGGHTFTRSYSNGRKSIDALPSVMSSIPSMQTPFVLLPQSLTAIRGIPGLLADEGYSTAFFNGSPSGSMGFAAYMKLVGVDRYFAQEDYEAARGTADFDGFWGIWDMSFLQYMETEISRMPEPFFASVFTLTSHHPFVVPAEFESLPSGRSKIHKPVAYTDLSIRRFFETASRQPWFDNTVFVFVADHVSSEIWADKTATPTGNSHIINFMYSPRHIAPALDSRTTEQIDIMPTLMGVLNYPKPFFAFGRNTIADTTAEPLAINYLNETYHCVTDSAVYYFNGDIITHAYKTTDTLERNNIANPDSPTQQHAERNIKAFLQQYYEHLDRKELVIK